MKADTLLCAACLALIMSACSYSKYTDPADEETINVDWGHTDLQTFSQEMADSLIEDPNLSYLPGANKGDDLRIKAIMGGISNETDEHVDTVGITDSIRTSLLQSGKFRFLADDLGQGEIGEQVRFQQGSGRVLRDEAVAFGKQHGAEVILYGTLRSITKKSGRPFAGFGRKTKGVYYQFVFNCVNIETGEIIWANESELSKLQKTTLFGSG